MPSRHLYARVHSRLQVSRAKTRVNLRSVQSPPRQQPRWKSPQTHRQICSPKVQAPWVKTWLSPQVRKCHRLTSRHWAMKIKCQTSLTMESLRPINSHPWKLSNSIRWASRSNPLPYRTPLLILTLVIPSSCKCWRINLVRKITRFANSSNKLMSIVKVGSSDFKPIVPIRTLRVRAAPPAPSRRPRWPGFASSCGRKKRKSWNSRLRPHKSLKKRQTMKSKRRRWNSYRGKSAPTSRRPRSWRAKSRNAMKRMTS